MTEDELYKIADLANRKPCYCFDIVERLIAEIRGLQKELSKKGSLNE